MNISKTHQLLEELKFKGMLGVVDQILADAEKKVSSTAEIINNLLREELRYRKERSLINRIKNASIPHQWSLTSFPFNRQPAIEKRQIMDLANVDFIGRGESIVFIGPPGVGKTGLGISLLREALVSGYRGKFYNVQDLIDDLYASLADHSTPKLLKRLCRFDIICLDEFGYATLNEEQANAFFKLLADRYQHGKSMIITTNLDYSSWHQVFKNKDMLAALLDRLHHRCITIRIDGDSLRKAKND
jgi:DNA replication protein DnaC